MGKYQCKQSSHMVEDIEDLVGGVYWSYTLNKSCRFWNGLDWCIQDRGELCLLESTNLLILLGVPYDRPRYLLGCSCQKSGYVSLVPCSHSMENKTRWVARISSKCMIGAGFGWIPPQDVWYQKSVFLVLGLQDAVISSFKCQPLLLLLYSSFGTQVLLWVYCR
jgi:hypothetical protein